MTDQAGVAAVLAAVACVVGGVLAGLALRAMFGRLARRAAGTATSWDDLWWNLLRGVALPATAITGAWWAAELLRLRSPVREFVDRVLLAVIVLTVALTIAGLAAGLVRSITLSRSGVAQSASIFVNVTRVLIIGVGVLVLLQSIGISVTPVLTALGVGGLAIALALQDTLGNVFAGIQILASKKVQPGDFVRLASGEDGHVVDINWRNTTVQQLAGNIVIVPNSHLADAILTNYHQPRQDSSVVVQVGVGYDSDLELVERITLEVGREVMLTVEGAVPEHEPVVRYHTFGESSIGFSVILRAAEYTARYLIIHEFIKRLHARYRAEEIEIPSSIRTVLLPGPKDVTQDRVTTIA
ncbi:mechanosensitive ion channel protein [Sphaerisporangium melleum]|uniref:Mechanosensitive ion channel protein n=1 Tax=Sphaerisporangium melleum TaxID=321316 RepID=A0A917RJ91_9ACTN|nr:mechanosensitive ion channel domain-containing protein [Sphaerisporangium melleum]GGL09630.1 mechanosensitive ion channel protein [Sphaerisporangium melleum]GII67589.1 mechanosensitive ion channel protein [Sphaerisporangium melleum]